MVVLDLLLCVVVWCVDVIVLCIRFIRVLVVFKFLFPFVIWFDVC